ncbi:MAG: DJ-1/PfpI family protein [Hyphomicrobiales bacterium]|nr:DJ-1/PfpI family protein [Hyphomicrobiales bacterium]
MTDKPLAGKKIAVLVEAQYIPHEIKTYQDRFAGYGAQVDLVSRLWGNPSLRIYSTHEPGVVEPIEWTEATVDVGSITPGEYAAVIMAANYTSVRLRWNEDSATSSDPATAVRSAPAPAFFRHAMLNRNVVKGAPCHGLWLLTPSPDVLAGRRVTCNPVVLADVINAGATFVPGSTNTPWDHHIVVDDDLVTSTSAHNEEVCALFVDAVKDAILARAAKAEAVTTAAAAPLPEDLTPGKRRILIMVSEWGYWGEELVGPLGEFDKAGYDVDFCTPTGRRPNAIPVSMDPDFFDPPLQRSVTSQEMAMRTREIDDPTTTQGKRLDNPISLADWFPERPYFSDQAFVRKLEAYNWALEDAVRGVEKYDAVLIVGGSGPIVDLCNNQRAHDLILAFLRAGKPIGAECYGVTCLAFARDMNQRESIIRGKHVTGHCLEYDYKDGTAFVEARGRFLNFNMGPPPYPLEFILRDATGPDGAYHGNFGHPTSVIVDYPFITGRSTPDSVLTGQKMIEVLDGNPPLRRWGW